MSEYSKLLETLHSIEATIEASNERLDKAEKFAADVEDRTSKRIKDMRGAVITKEHLRTRRRQAILIAVCITLIGFVLEHITITKCFLAPSTTGWSQSTCAALFPGYNKARTISEERARQFNEILRQVPVNQQDVESLDQRLTRLEQSTTSKEE